jgi:hypothetical protein
MKLKTLTVLTSKRLRPDSSKDADQDVGEEADLLNLLMETNL